MAEIKSENGVLRVQMMGGFSITCGDRAVTENDGRTKKIWMLIEYLLANRKKDISQERLIEILWEDEEGCEAPFNALKNLVYRARKILMKLSDEKLEYIKFVRNTYSWNNDIPCTMDIEEFERNWSEASQAERPDDERIERYSAAIALYRGEFLPKSSYSSWVVAKNAYYMSIYHECVTKLSELLAKKDHYEEIITICENAVALYPFEEEIHHLLLTAYIKDGKQAKALSHYDYILNLFKKEMNVDLSNSLKSLRKEIVKSINAVETDLSIIKKDLREAYDIEGAFYCDYETFKNIYRLQARSMMRTGQSIHIALVTLSDRNGDLPKAELLTAAMNKMQYCIVHSLRKGDVVAKYSAAQFVVTLPLTTYENGEAVLSRIVDRFKRSFNNYAIQINTRLDQVDPKS